MRRIICVGNRYSAEDAAGPAVYDRLRWPATARRRRVDRRWAGRIGLAAACRGRRTRASGDTLAYAFDEKNLYFRVTLGKPLPENGRIGFHLSVPRQENVYPYGIATDGETPALLGIAAKHAIEWNGKDLQLHQAGRDGWGTGTVTGDAAFQDGTLEASIPWGVLGDLSAGDDLRLVSVVMPSGDLLPASGSAQIVLPDLGTSTTIVQVEDPQGDDHGPGTYTYPTDGVFAEQAFDLKSFSAGYNDNDLIFKFIFNGPVPNPWGAASENELQVRANVGVVLCGEENASVDAILRDAENALELAKSNRRKMIQSLRTKNISATTDITTSPSMG